MLRICEMFCNYSRMKLAPAKSCSYGYGFSNNVRQGLSHSFIFNGENIPYVGLEDSIRYLGGPIAARKSGKIKTSCDIMLKTSGKLQKNFNSGLLISQMIHAVKMFIIPSLDSIIVNIQEPIQLFKELEMLLKGSV